MNWKIQNKILSNKTFGTKVEFIFILGHITPNNFVHIIKLYCYKDFKRFLRMNPDPDFKIKFAFQMLCVLSFHKHISKADVQIESKRRKFGRSKNLRVNENGRSLV